MGVTSGDRTVNRNLSGVVMTPALLCKRTILLGGTALQAAFFLGLSVAAHAQGIPTALVGRAAILSATALPTGGQVVAGNARIAQSGTTLNVTQTSNNAGVNWRSFDVGSAGTVNFTAPSAQSLTINRVVGPDPSVIAGRINANNQQVLINQSGVLFTNGAQVNAASLVVSAIGITDANLKAGRLVLDQPARPGAAVVNQGHITVAQTGLAALVAPQVINSGVIQAKLGRVVLAGAEAATVDLYGDGLMSIDVTRQVSTAPTGPDGKLVTSLVTNTGTIIAHGGTVLLTAQAADGIVTNLVMAGGKISANSAVDGSAGGHVGQIAITATGGSVGVTGSLSAQGRSAGTRGGTVEVNATGAASIGAQAKINVSGKAGGGTVAIGTTVARAKSGPGTAAQVAAQAIVAPGAKIAADATQSGTGGNVTILSSGLTYMAGGITARGGRSGGDGGSVEVSGNSGYRLTGSVDVSAKAGKQGALLIDPLNLTIGTSSVDNALVVPALGPDGLLSSTAVSSVPPDAFITPASFSTLTGNVTLQASSNLTVTTGFSFLAANLLLQAGKDLTVNGAITSGTAAGNLTLAAATAGFANSDPAGKLTINAAVAAGSAGTLKISAGTTGITLAANATGAVVDLNTTGGGVVQSAGSITTASLLSSGGTTGNVLLNQTTNAIDAIGTFNAGTGQFSVSDANALTQSGVLTAGSITLVGSNAAASALTLNGTLAAGDRIQLKSTAGGITLAGAISTSTGTNTVTLDSTGDVRQAVGSSITTATLTSSAGFGGTIDLISPTNAIGTAIGIFSTSATGSVSLVNGQNLTLVGRFGTASGTTSAVTVVNGGQLTLGAASAATLETAGRLSVSADTIVLGNAANALTGHDAAGSVIEIAPHSSRALTVSDVAVAASLTLPSALIGAIGHVDTLRLGAVAGATTASAISFNTVGTLSFAKTLDLQTTGGVTQWVGNVLSAGTLTGSSSGATALNGGNTIAVLGPYSTISGDLSFTNNANLTTSGLVKAGGSGVLTLNTVANNLVIGNGTAATLEAGGALNLSGIGGTITGGANSVTLKAGAAFTLPKNITTAGATTINLGALAFTANGKALNTSGNALSITAGNIDLTGAGSAMTAAGSTVTFASSGTVNEGGQGVITASSLSGSATGAATLDGANVLDGIGPFSAAGLTLTNTTAMGLTGLVNGGTSVSIDNGANNLTVAAGAEIRATSAVLLKAANLTINGTVDDGVAGTAGTGTLTFNSTGSIDASVGAITAGTLTGSATGSALFSGTNTVAALSNFTSGDTLRLTDAKSLTVSNTNSATTRVQLGVTGSLTLTGALTTGVLDLSATGSVAQTGGTITAATLNSTSGLGANVTLTRTGNKIINLGPLTATGTLALRSDTDLTVAGATQASSGYLTVGVANGTLAINTPLAVTSNGTLALQADKITAAGTVNTSTLGLLEIASFSTVDLASGVAGPLSASVISGISTGTLHLGAAHGGSTTASNISLAALDLTGKAGTLQLDSRGNLNQTGKLTVGTLVGTAGGTVDLSGAVNAIGAIAAPGLTAATGIKLSDGVALGIVGPVALTGTGTIAIATDTLNFTGAGALSAAGGTVEIGPQTGAAVRIGTTSGTGIVLGDLSRISTTTLRVGSSSLNAITASAINLSGNAATSASTLRLDASTASTSGTILQSAGALSANTITGSAGGDITLVQSGNVFSGLGALISGGNVSVNAGTASTLSVTGTVSSGADKQIVLTAKAIDVGGALSISNAAGGGLVKLAADTVTLPGTITNTGGTVSIAPITTGAAMKLGGGTGGIALSHIAAPTVLLGRLDVAGTTTAGSIDIAGSSVANAVTSKLGLFASNAVNESSGGLTIGTLFGTAGSFALGNTNAIGTLGQLTATTGGASVVDTGTLIIAGTVIASTPGQAISLTADTLNITSAASGTIKSTGGTIALIADTLTLPGAPATDLIDTGTGLVSLSPRSGIAFAFGTGSGVSGAIKAGTLELGGFGSTLASTLTLSTINFTGSLILHSLGTISQTGSLAVTGTLSGNAGGAVTLLTAGNAVGTLGNFSGAAFNFKNGAALNVTGLVNGGTSATIDTGTNALTVAAGGEVRGTGAVLLKSGLMTINGLVDDGSVATPGTGIVTLTSSGNIVENAGTITAGTLTGSATGSATLTGTNLVTAMTGFSGAGFAFIDGRALSVTGLVNGGVSATIDTGTNALTVATGGEVRGTSTVLLKSGLMTVAGLIDDGSATTAGTGTVTLTSSGNIVESTGTITAGTLTGSAAGQATLTGTNLVSTLISFSAGGLSLTDGRALNVTGLVNGGTSATIDTGTAALTIAAGAEIRGTSTVLLKSGLMTINGLLDDGSVTVPGTGTITLASTGSIVESAGTLTAGSLAGSATGSATFTGINRVTTLGNFSATSFNLIDASSLFVTGLANGGATTTIDTGANALTVATGGEVRGTSAVLLKSGLMTVAGLIDDGSAATPGTGTVTLTSSGNILENAGTLTVGTLTGSAAGSATLTGTNLVSTLPSFSAAGFTFTDGRALNVTGFVNGGTVATIDTGANALTIATGAEVRGTSNVLLKSGLMTINGLLDDGSASVPGTGTITLTSSNNVVENAGTISAGALGGSAIGSATLTGTNRVTTLGNFSAAGFSLIDGSALAVTGLVNGGATATIDTGANALTIATGGEVRATGAVLLKSGLLTLNGLVDDGSAATPGAGTITLNSSGNIVESAGTLTAGTLTGSATGSAMLTGTNLVSTLATFSAAGFRFTDARALNVSGLVNGGANTTINAGANALTIATGSEVRGTSTVLLKSGLMTLNGVVDDGSAATPGTGTITLNSSGNIIESAGALTAGTLTGSATGSATLTGTNLVATLSDFSTQTFSFTDGRAVNVTGFVSTVSATIDTGANALTIATGAEVGGSSAVLLKSGLMTINGRIDDGDIATPGTGTVTLTSSGNIVESSGTLTAGTLTGSATGQVTLTGTNLVSILGSFSAAGVNLINGRALSVTGLVNGGTSTTIDTGANAFTVATGAELRGTSSVLLKSGVMTINGGVDDGSVVTPGSGTITLNSSGNIVESAGTLTAGTLTGNATGAATLTGINLVTALANFSAAGFTFTNGRALAVTGLVSGGTAATIDTGANALTIATGAEIRGTGNVLLKSGLLNVAGLLDDGSATVPGTGTITLVSTGNVVESAGTITADTLNGSAAGSATLTGTNLIGTSTNFASNGLSIKDNKPLVVTGLVSGGTGTTIDTGSNSLTVATGGEVRGTSSVLLKSGLLTINGLVDDGSAATPGTGTVTFTSLGNIVETSGTITAGSLTGSATGSATLTGTNLVTTLTNFGSAGFTFTDGRALNVTGLVNGGAAVTIDTGTNALTVASAGEVRGTSTVLLKSGLMTLSGLIDDGSAATPGIGNVTLISVANILENGGTITAGTLDLTAATGVSQTAGVINAGTLLSTGGVGGDVTLNQAGNTITTLGSFNDGASMFSLTDASALTQIGTLTAATVGITDSAAAVSAISITGAVNTTARTALNATAGGIALSGGLNGNAGTLDLNATAGVSQTAGSIIAGTLLSTSGVTGNVILNQPTNAITTLATLNDGAGIFSLTDASALTQTGTLTAATAGITDSNVSASAISVAGAVNTTVRTTLSATAGGIALAGNLNGNTGTLDFNAATGVSQTAGSITAGTLLSTSGVTGNVTLNQPTNAITTMASFNDGTGIFSLTDASALTQTGTLTAATVGITDSNVSSTAISITGAVNTTARTTLTATAGGIGLSGNLNGNAGTLDLNAATGVSQTAGSITAGTLLSTSGVTGNAVLNQPANAITTLAGFNDVGGSFALTDAVALAQTGTLSATSGSVAITDTSGANPAISANGVIRAGTSLALLAANGGLAVNGSLNGGTGVNLVASSAGVIEAAGATIATPQLTGSLTGTGAITLVGTGNTVSGVGNLTASGGSITLVDTVDPNVTGIVSANTIALTQTGPAGITISGTLNGASSVSLNTAGGGVREANGRIIAGSLASATGITGDATLTGSANQIGNLASLAVSAGTLRLTDAQSLTLSGPVSASNGTSLTVSGNLSMAGSLNSAGQVVTLASTGALAQTGGVITAGILNASGTSISLTQPNLVATLGTVSSPGAVGFRDAQAFTVGGPITGSSVTLATTNGIGLAGNVTTPGVLDISAAGGGVSQSGGAISAAILQSASGISGDLSLTSGGNRVLALGAMNTGGALSLVTASPLTVNGQLTTGGAGRLQAGGPLVFASNWTGPSLDVSTSAGGVSQTSGILTLGTLSAASIAGPASFTSAGNRVATLGATTVSGGNLSLIDNVNLAVTGPVSAPDISITTPGSITLPGAINTGTLALSAGGGIVRPLGAQPLTVGFLTGNASQVADFGKSANVTQLGSFSVGNTGTLSLDNAQPLRITGPLSADYIGIYATGLLTITGTVNTVGLPASTQLASPTPVDPGSYFAVRADSSGNALINQVGTLTIQSSGGGANPIVRFFLPATGGKIIMENTQGSTATVLLSTGNGGVSTGSVNLNGLVVIGTNGSASLNGVIRNSTGPEAARLALIQPAPNTTYRINACPIGSVNCVLIPLGVLPVANPLRDFVLDAGRTNSDDDDLALPDISSRDY